MSWKLTFNSDLISNQFTVRHFLLKHEYKELYQVLIYNNASKIKGKLLNSITLF